jgi:prepilin-type N-terminal cleavage/methylation domain-containing protein
MSRARGFTLIELLVVVAIIALLLSILMPSLSKARELASRVACATNLKAAAVAHHMYAHDNAGFFYLHTEFGNSYWNQPNYWPAVSADEPLTKLEYLGNYEPLYCVNFEQFSRLEKHMQWDVRCIGYVMFVNCWWNSAAGEPYPDRKFDSIENVTPEQAMAQDILVDSTTGQFVTAHSDGGNVLYTDSRVQWTQLESLTDNHQSAISWFSPGIWLMYPEKM